MSIHVCSCMHHGVGEWHLRYPGMSQEAAQGIADKINSGMLDGKQADRIAALEAELAQARADHLAAIEQARKEEREAWSKWADAVVAELELRAKINNDPYLEISRLRFVELDTLRARKP